MFNFLKKKKTEEKKAVPSETSLDDLPPAPKPDSATAPSYTSDEPYIPPIPKNNDLNEPTTPFGQAYNPQEELEPLPESPKLPENKPLIHEEEELNEPAPLHTKNGTPVSPKDIDPRDHFDDLIKPSELPAGQVQKAVKPIPPKPPEESMPAFSPEKVEEDPVKKERETSWKLPSSMPKLEKDYFDTYDEKNMELPSAKELAEVLKPKPAEKSFITDTGSKERIELPKMPETKKSSLPGFEAVKPIPEQTHTPDFPLPDVHFGKVPESELAIFVSVNDYALITQNMRKLMKFFKSSGKLLGQADNPEKVHVLNDLYKDLNSAQQNLMNLDKKLFERDSYGA